MKTISENDEKEEDEEEIVVEEKNLDQNLEENLENLSEDEKKEIQIKRYNEFVCNICKFESVNKECKLRHAYTHGVNKYQGEKDYICLRCPKIFKILDELRDHYVEDHKLTFDCLFCDIKHTKKHALISHMRNMHIHSVLSCDECDFSTPKICILRYHKTFHNNKDNNYKCKYCSYRAKSEGKKFEHQNQHHKKNKKK